MKTRTEKWLTVNALAVKTHAERRHILRWLEIESVASKIERGRKVFEPAAAVAAIKAHQRKPRADQQSGADEEVVFTVSEAEKLIQTRDICAGMIHILNERTTKFFKDAEAHGFSDAQKAWIVTELNGAWSEAWQFVPPTHRALVETAKKGAQ